MALPSSGQISILDIVNEGTGGGCYIAELGGYSLGSLATAFGIPGNPDAMSEFYGLACPFTATTIYYFTTNDGFAQGFRNNSEACLYWDLYLSSTVYYTGTLGDGTQLWFNSEGTSPFDNAGGWFHIDGYVFELEGNSIFNYQTCA